MRITDCTTEQLEAYENALTKAMSHIEIRHPNIYAKFERDMLFHMRSSGKFDGLRDTITKPQEPTR